MTDEQKQAYFCHTHTNLFSQNTCKVCYRGMCHTCLNNNSEKCPECLKSSFRNSDHYKNQKEIIYILAISGVTTLLFHIFQFVSIPDIYQNTAFLKNVAYISLGSLCIMSAYYMFSDVTLIKDISKVPFIGGKLAFIFILLSLVSGIPILYFLYKIFIFLKHKMQ